MKKLALCLGLVIGSVLFVRAQTNTNRLFGVPYLYFTNTNGVVFMNANGKQGVTTNNMNGTNWFLVSGSSSNEPMWRFLSTTNLAGSFNLANSYGGIPGGLTTNIDVIRGLDGVTNYLCFTNGLLMNIVSNAP